MATVPPWTVPLSGLSLRCFGDRLLMVTADWRTNLRLRQLGPLFGISKPRPIGSSTTLGRNQAPQAARTPC